MTSKGFSKALAAIITIFFLTNVILYFGWVDNKSFGADGHGDLANLASMAWSKSLTEQKKYERHHLELDDYLERTNNGEAIKVDVLTIGDSFTNSGGGAFYQDYLVTKYGVTVVNVPSNRIKGLEALGMVEVLRNNGMLTKIKPKVVIVESVERYLFGRYDDANYLTDVPALDELTVIKNFTKNKTKPVEKQDKFFPGYMIKRNINYLHEQSRKWRNKERDVSFAKLNKNTFTAVGKENELMYITWDFTNPKINPDVEQTAKNIQTVADNLKAMGIELVFLPCPDKSSVYYPFLQPDGREYAAKPELDELLAVKRDYYMVDAKHILQQAVADGAVDVYWADDTHWSWRGFEIVVDEMMKNINIVK